MSNSIEFPHVQEISPKYRKYISPCLIYIQISQIQFFAKIFFDFTTPLVGINIFTVLFKISNFYD